MEQVINKTQKTQKKIMPGSGVWIERPRRSTILVCTKCGGKYIKTRPGQNACVRCLANTSRR